MELNKAIAWLLLTAALCVVGVERNPPASGITAESRAVEREPLDKAANKAANKAATSPDRADDATQS